MFFEYVIFIVISLVFCGIGFFSQYESKVKVGQWTETKDWGDIVGGYQGNVGDKVTYDTYEYIEYTVSNNPLIIILTVLFVVLVIATFVCAYLKKKKKLAKEATITSLLRWCAFGICIVTMIAEAVVSKKIFFGYHIWMFVSFAVMGFVTYYDEYTEFPFKKLFAKKKK